MDLEQPRISQAFFQLMRSLGTGFVDMMQNLPKRNSAPHVPVQFVEFRELVRVQKDAARVKGKLLPEPHCAPRSRVLMSARISAREERVSSATPSSLASRRS